MNIANTIVFTHIPKVAGSSLVRRLIQENYSSDEIRRFRGVRDLCFNRQECRVLIGHNPFGMGDFMNGNIKYFTILREPVSRVISHYFFIRQDPLDPAKEGNHKQKELHRSVGLGEIFARTSHLRLRPASSWLIDNLMTRYTAGYRHFWRKKNSSKLLKAAKKNLLENYEIFGIQDRYEESLNAIAERFNWTLGPHENHLQATRVEKIYTASDLDVIRANSQLDIELYEFACELFSERFG